MNETINTIIKWHRNSLPDATLNGQIKKYAEETCEFVSAKKKDRLDELADMVIVCAGIIRFNKQLGRIFLQNTYIIAAEYDYDMTELWNAIDKKMEINRHKRTWKMTDAGVYRHREDDEKD